MALHADSDSLVTPDQYRSRVLTKRLTIEPLPAFSPEYNPIEKFWCNTKKDATHLKYFNTFEELRASVLLTFRKYLDDATHTIRVISKLRTEAGIA